MTFGLKDDTKLSKSEVVIASAPSDTSESTKNAFFGWLSAGNAKKYSPSTITVCLDRISEYALSKKISFSDLWSVTKPSVFKPIYNKLLEAKLLRIADRNTYNVFIVAGQLYLKFLKEKPFATKASLVDTVEPVQIVEEQPTDVISPESLITWLTTQPNSNGTLYLENVVRQYVRYLCSAPIRLDLPLSMEERDVFACHTVAELNTLWETFRTAPNYKMVNSDTRGSFSAGLSCLSRYLEHLSGNSENNAAAVPAPKQFSATIQTNKDKHNMNTTMFVDFDRPEQCAQTRPVSCTINGQAVIPKKQNWSQLLVAITERLIAEGNPNLADLDRMPLYGSKVFFMPNKADFGTCALLSSGKWIYTNYNPQTVVTIIRNLCRHCGVALEDVLISFVPKNTPIERSGECIINSNTNPYDPTATQAMFEPKIFKTVMNVLSAHFPNGFRVDSPIELMRFRNFAAEYSADDIPLADEELKKVIVSCGHLFEGKVYVVGKETESRLQEEIDAEVDSGAEVIYYASVYARHENWLFAGSVISEDMLKGMLKKLYPAYLHKSNYFLTKRNNGTELAIIKNEIMRVWRGDILLNYEQISERLPYIPLEKIKYVLAQNGDFIWNSTEVYTHIGMVDISDEERSEIENYVANACRTVGYASISDVPLGELREHNYELTLTAIHNAVFAIVLSNKYDKRGKIITRKGDMLDALTIMKEHCRIIDKCSLQDLLDYERELTGETHRWIPMEAGYAVLVRTAKNSFVAEKYVRFDIDRIDDALDLFVTGDYLPLKSITTFATFPYCGQVWNLFLLESYCRRFSRRFRFEVLAVNSRNAGAIVRKNCRLTYSEIMADAVAVSGVELDKVSVIEFLCSTGYIGKRSYAKTEELIEQAKAIREREK